ncbi:helix-turn-helix domain-containing protein [Metabacillus niabensis]|uniref:YesN/AraC family two-component response regulator n=2 Tax=Metabacillus niabensis TaxID=324854 RepID=A0ABT9Z6K5_9BACI|nr:helix-turn-helix domain-containing protein [Metabacillus niabensis]MDQ0227837.1 YesN/AraC family two-component response regulator [Metabacillus niabensis]
MITNIEKYKHKCKIISDLHDVSTFFITPSGNIIFEYIDQRKLNPLYHNDKQNLFSLLNFEPDKQYSFPVIKKTYFFENYIIISVLQNNEFIGTVVIGPTLPYVLFEQKINGIINDFHVFTHREQVFNYYKMIPIISKEKIIHLGVMSNYLINNILLSPKEVAYENNLLKQKSIGMEPTNIISEKANPYEASHHDPLLEKQLLSIIKEGRIEELRMFTKLEEETTGVLSKTSHVRSKKNLGIVAIAIATRAAIDGGLHSEIAFSLSDSYIQRLEDLASIEEIDNLQMEAIFTFTKRVSEVKEQQHTITVTICKNYIYSNRFEKITHEDVANIVQLSQSYLSVLFKKEVGISVSDYIQKIKIEEAKNLIAYTNTPLSEISSLLQFTDQSYFTKVFKKFEGITPKQYKERHHLI